MPADPITPGLATAWSNAAPSQSPVVPYRLQAFVRQATNIAIPGSGGLGVVPTYDGTSIEGPQSTVLDRAVFLTNQTDSRQNGLYIPFGDDAGPTWSGTFDSITGLWTKTGLTVGRLYQWVKASNETSITNGTTTLTETGFIQASPSGTLTVTGQNGTAVSSQLWQTYLGRASTFNTPDEAIAGTVVTVTGGASGVSVWQLRNSVATFGTSTITFDQVSVTGFTPGNAAAWDNTAPATSTPGLATAWDNTAPTGFTPSNAAAFDNTPPTQIVIVGELPPVAGSTSPGSVTTADQTTTLVAGLNYLVNVGSRAANVTINLPDPGSQSQRVEIADVSGQAATRTITVNAGTKTIVDTGAATYVLNRNFAVLTLYYTGTAWKIA